MEAGNELRLWPRGARGDGQLPRHNLPANLGTLIGRDTEVATLLEQLRKTRLLTLTGAGGCGKTRLALEVALRTAEGFPDGVWLVELGALADPELVPHQVASILGIVERPGSPPASTIVEALRFRDLLIVLDNCEHLVDACARLSELVLST